MTDLAIGLMSGTSLDGIDAALVRFRGERPEADLLAFHSTPYGASARDRITAAVVDGSMRECALLHVWLGHQFAAAAAQLLRAAGVAASDIGFVALHGHTVWHEPGVASLQLGDPAIVAERLGTQVVSDFRARDVAAGGQGAPLVPVADVLLFGDTAHDRVLLNVGGIANVTWVPRDGTMARVRAFDTGPGMGVVDAVVRHFDPSASYDVDGTRAARGTPVDAVVLACMTDAYFDQPLPKSTGRERFGDAYATSLVDAVRRAHPEATPEDCVATALDLTVRSIAEQTKRWLPAAPEVVIAGGGARNPHLVRRLRESLSPTAVLLFADLFFDGDAKEAVAFALLGWLTLRGRPGDIPSATGAVGPRVLGRVTPA